MSAGNSIVSAGCAAALSIVAVAPLFADTPDAIEDVDFEVMDPSGRSDRSDPLTWGQQRYAPVERALDVPLPRTVRKGYLQFVIGHRNRTPVDEDTFHNFFGFDGGNLKIGLGLYYGLLDNWDVGVYRLNGTVEKFDTWQFSTKWQALSETNRWVDFAVLGGASLYTISGEEEDWGGFVSPLFGRSLGEKFYASAGALYHSNSSALDKTAADTDYSTAVLGSLTARVSPRVMLVGEFSTPVAGYQARSTAWAGGIKFVTWGHSFSFLAGNTQSISLDGLAAGTALEGDEVVLGFVITRDFKLSGR
jgi:hypothetical protein